MHPWAIFCITALALAYFSYRKGLPFSLRSILYPIIGNRIYGPIGHTVDILTIVITAFGVAQSLSMSVLQINSGLNQVFGFENSLSLQFIMLTILCGIATISVVMGINRGMQRLSELNMILAILLIAILLIIGPTRYLFNTLFEATGNYTQNLISMSLWSDAQKDSGWQNWWTAFYWPWWMTWGPFVGMFIARISRGRTIRELIAGVLIVPTLVTAIWMSVVGGSALKVEQDARHAYEKHAAALVKAGEPAPEPFTGGPIVKATQADNTRALLQCLIILIVVHSVKLLVSLPAYYWRHSLLHQPIVVHMYYVIWTQKELRKHQLKFGSSGAHLLPFWLAYYFMLGV